MRKILISVVLMTTAFALFGQSRIFDEAKNTFDPFIAEKGGFDSLFVNPAGMADQSEFFVYELEAGTAGKKSTYETLELLLGNQDLIMGSSDPSAPQELDPADAEAMLDLLVDALEESNELDTITAGTSFDGWSAQAIQEYFANGEPLTQEDANIIQQNIEDNPQVVENAVNSFIGELKVKVEATTRLGTLIKGFGLGVYGNAYTILDAGQMGFDTIVGETGLKAGFGWNMGPLALGVSGDFAMIGTMNSVSIDQIMVADILYGYAWGIDVGATFSILPSLTVGAVITDIIGSYAPAGYTNIEELMGGAMPSTNIPYEYSFDLDFDMGITWAPVIGNGKLFAPSVSLDYYDFIGMFRPETQPQNFQDFINHIRIGAELELLSFINAKAQYYQEFFTVGAGVDLLFFEVFGEFMFDQRFEEIGGSVLMKLHF